MPTLEETLRYLGIDYADDMVIANVERAMKTALKTLHGSVGEDVDILMPDDPRVTELVLIFADDLYSNRGVSAKVSGATRNLVHTMELQLRLELRQLREKVEA